MAVAEKGSRLREVRKDLLRKLPGMTQRWFQGPDGCDLFLWYYAFAKNERDNIASDELSTLREIGATWLRAEAGQLAQAIEDGVLYEVPDDEYEEGGTP